ncbi:cytochrome c oxidase cbb3-type subunit 2 [Anseongella ginsenosidimutans]|uniref:Cytochrome c oxidase cbb3-type subunit 2 n=1 Tax=Anseongella ginsenosidimutans TaxID=496056 RepID=A0A4R3KU00_9SPHI|nr:cbb3-type cytochrome c oxidase subunit II [Anseongella ginsenosidimutans]QEC53169.1 c-type cytochrome [Anseongella ginsenosidimutans]TCS87795.1 cytochrome c oxidase cbb3-type subunit 2 [Anseongella ginsenosidimutans]
MHFHKNHKSLVLTSFFVFLLLSTGVAILPALQMQEQNAPLPGQPELTELELKGLRVYIAEGCVACHTQQVRSIEMDKMWGSRPSIPSDYYYSKKRLDTWRQSPSLLGSERTGPDLSNIGKRQPSEEWHLLHLYNPRLVVKGSVMPSYPWLFKEKESPERRDKILNLPDTAASGLGASKIVASQDALALVAYLKSLKQQELPQAIKPSFIPSKKKPETAGSAERSAGLPDGAALYTQTCAACHQPNGQGLAGAFPPLAGSPVVNDDDPETLIRIILQGYDARPEFASMPPFAAQLTNAEIAAIATHERTSWGNKAGAVTKEEVEKIRETIENTMQ